MWASGSLATSAGMLLCSTDGPVAWLRCECGFSRLLPALIQHLGLCQALPSTGREGQLGSRGPVTSCAPARAACPMSKGPGLRATPSMALAAPDRLLLLAKDQWVGLLWPTCSAASSHFRHMDAAWLALQQVTFTTYLVGNRTFGNDILVMQM